MAEKLTERARGAADALVEGVLSSAEASPGFKAAFAWALLDAAERAVGELTEKEKTDASPEAERSRELEARNARLEEELAGRRGLSSAALAALRELGRGRSEADEVVEALEPSQGTAGARAAIASLLEGKRPLATRPRPGTDVLELTEDGEEAFRRVTGEEPATQEHHRLSKRFGSVEAGYGAKRAMEALGEAAGRAGWRLTPIWRPDGPDAALATESGKRVPVWIETGSVPLAGFASRYASASARWGSAVVVCASPATERRVLEDAKAWADGYGRRPERDFVLLVASAQALRRTADGERPRFAKVVAKGKAAEP